MFLCSHTQCLLFVYICTCITMYLVRIGIFERVFIMNLFYRHHFGTISQNQSQNGSSKRFTTDSRRPNKKSRIVQWASSLHKERCVHVYVYKVHVSKVMSVFTERSLLKFEFMWINLCSLSLSLSLSLSTSLSPSSV